MPSHPYPATSPPITDPETVALWASHEAANRRAADQYAQFPTMEREVLIDAAIDAALDECGSFTVRELRVRLGPYYTHERSVNAHIGRLVQRGVLTGEGVVRRKRFRWFDPARDLMEVGP